MRVMIGVSKNGVLVHSDTLHVPADREIEWVAEDDLIVEFTGKSPFEKRRFANGESSGRPIVKPGRTRYPFVVRSGSVNQDPDVVVDPPEDPNDP